MSTTKGTGGDIIILEEAAYVSSGVCRSYWAQRSPRAEMLVFDDVKAAGFFYETVAPLLCIGNTSFIAISTLTSEMNFYTVNPPLLASSHAHAEY